MSLCWAEVGPVCGGLRTVGAIKRTSHRPVVLKVMEGRQGKLLKNFAAMVPEAMAGFLEFFGV